jgi:hypothetical protein
MKTNNEIERDIVLEKECKKLSDQNAALLDFVYLAAASKRRDGTFNNCRDSLHKKANNILDKINL